MTLKVSRAAVGSVWVIACLLLGCSEPRGNHESQDGGSGRGDAGTAVRTDGGQPVGSDAGTHDVPDGDTRPDTGANASDTDAGLAPPDVDAGVVVPTLDAGWLSEVDAGLARDDAGITGSDAGPPPTTWVDPPPSGLVASRGDVGRKLGITVGRYGAVTIGFSDDSNGWVVLAHGESGGFRTETVASDVGSATLLSVARDSADRLHVGYGSVATGTIRHAVRDDAGRWEHQALVSRFTNAQRHGSLAVDTSGRPRFAYAGTEPDGAKSLIYSDFDGTMWRSEVVDRELGYALGDRADLELDAHDVPHIAYLNYTTGRWRYARWNGTAWASEVVSGARGDIMPLALDSEGVPSVAYLTVESAETTSIERVVVARAASAGWTTEVVYQGESAVKALAIDHLDRPHVVYTTGAPATELHYARKRGRAWEDIVIDTAMSGTFGGPAALAIDARGNAHIAYQETAALNVKYAFVAGRAADEDPCLGVVCPDRPAAWECVTASAARETASEGRCVLGLCEYATVDTACEGGCIRNQCRRGSWTEIAGGAPKTFLPGHVAAWTGTEMYLWGLTEGTQQTVRFNPLTGTWVTNALRPSPIALEDPAGAWTGTGLTLWGGIEHERFTLVASGFTVDTADTLLETLPESPLSARSGHTAVWTGSELIVWGGADASLNVLSDGAAYSPSTRTWRRLSTVGAPLSRVNHTAVWTGREMIIFGGCSSGCFGREPTLGLPGSGSRYDPSTDTWGEGVYPPRGEPGFSIGRDMHSAVWTGSEMIVWGGRQRGPRGTEAVASGFAYDPVTDTARVISNVGATPRMGHSAVWTGSEMIVWGGQLLPDGPLLNNGARFRP